VEVLKMIDDHSISARKTETAAFFFEDVLKLGVHEVGLNWTFPAEFNSFVLGLDVGHKRNCLVPQLLLEFLARLKIAVDIESIVLIRHLSADLNCKRLIHNNRLIVSQLRFLLFDV
jgi:hypothetical protein